MSTPIQKVRATKIMSYQEAKSLEDMIVEKVGIAPPGRDTLRYIIPHFPKGTSRLLIISPEMAEAMLRTQRKNRVLYKTNIRRLKDAIAHDEWRVTGETIIFDDEGHLIDGQHRLLACIAANKPIKTYVVFGQVDEHAVMVMDTGMSRTPGDMIHIMGRGDSHHHAATIRWIHRLRTGGMRFEKEKISREKLLELVEKENLTAHTLHIGRKLGKMVKPSLGSALYHEMQLKDAILAQQLFDGIINGTTLPGSMVHLLREALITNTLHRARLDEAHVAAMIIKVWRALRRGITLKKNSIRWYPERKNRVEPFPIID